MPTPETIEAPIEKFFANGHTVVQKIIDHGPDEGLVITWVRPDLKPTLIDAVGLEAPLYAHVKNIFPDLSKVAGACLTIVSDEDGFVQSIGIMGGKPMTIEEN